MESNTEVKQNIEKDLIEDKKLNCTWTFWYASRKENVRHIPYEDRLTEVFSFSTLKEFFDRFMFIKDIDSIPRHNEISLFKKGYKPLWESCPDGACWFLRFKKTDSPIDINYKWEKLIFAMIGEQLDEPNILGAVLSIRGRETIIELWFNYFKYEKIKNTLAQKLRVVLQIDSNYNIYFKDNEKSLMDKSTIRNAETYSFKKQRKSTFN